MDFEKFVDYCSVDFAEGTDPNKTQVLVIFSSGMNKEFSSEFVKKHPEITKRLVAHDLYNYTKEQFYE